MGWGRQPPRPFKSPALFQCGVHAGWMPTPGLAHYPCCFTAALESSSPPMDPVWCQGPSERCPSLPPQEPGSLTAHPRKTPSSLLLGTAPCTLEGGPGTSGESKGGQGVCAVQNVEACPAPEPCCLGDPPSLQHRALG
ncbi:hypothetical protein DR999_PMT19100 [Platysternon megacephalum]|uniref:Uncharacterized protein n=1 Tax=Platysternon megacephalum TaxID=55544 RepID=A0A4D9DVN1_9SAUR|nr:hypothetical protein DR999_PMT19100 [Platysternon megacephalum]